MSLFEQLIHLNTSDYLLDRAYEYWQKEDKSLTRLMPASGSVLLRFEVDTGWSGFIDLREWFCNVYPKLAIMSVRCMTSEQLYELFFSSNKPIIVPEKSIYTLLQFETIISMALIEDAQFSFSQHCFSINTETGRLWITRLLEHHLSDRQTTINGDHHIIYTLPLCLKFIVGRSKLSLVLFKKIKIGDILLIQQMAESVAINNQIIGNYKIDNENIMIDLHRFDFTDQSIDHESNKEKIMDNLHKSGQQREAAVFVTNCKNKIPIRLSFILDHREIKLAELESIAQGQMLSLAPECYKSIEIEANGMPIGQGEMVMLDDKMAVEIKVIYGESVVK